MPGPDIAVTGLGLVTPAGVGTTATWRGVCAGVSAADHDPSLIDQSVSISCRVPGFEPAAMIGGRKARRMDRFVQFAVLAVGEAIADAGLDPSTWDGARVGVVLGCADGGPGTVEQQHRVMLTHTPEQVSPLLLPMQLPNMLAGTVSTELSARGPSLVVSTACASGTTAIGLARDLLILDRCDIVLTGGSEAMITPLVIAGFAKMGALSRRLDEPRLASRPFDVARDGFVAGEGAGLLVLERRADAVARGARARALVAGFGASADAHHVTAPDPDGVGLELAVRTALTEAGVRGDEVDHVNAHGTSTPQGDIAESTVLHRVLGSRPLVASTKGVTGHLFGAAGAVEAALSVLAIEHDTVPPTANLTELDPMVRLPVSADLVRGPIDVVLSTSMGFGGQNAAVVLTTP
jgi:3-oxoacyl-[acyl-carrier-protein] synthase II